MNETLIIKAVGKTFWYAPRINETEERDSWATAGRFPNCKVGRLATVVRHREKGILRAILQSMQPAVGSTEVTCGVDADDDRHILERFQRVAAWAVQADVEVRDLPLRACAFPEDVEAVDRLAARRD